MYGEVQLDEDMKAYLNLGPKFRENAKIKREDLEVEVEMTAVQTRMQKRKQAEEDNEKESDDETRKRLEDDEERMRNVYDPEKRSISFARQRATDAKYNTRSFLPRMAKAEDEIKIQVQKDDVLKMINKFIKEECEKDQQKKSNLTEKERRSS